MYISASGGSQHKQILMHLPKYMYSMLTLYSVHYSDEVLCEVSQKH